MKYQSILLLVLVLGLILAGCTGSVAQSSASNQISKPLDSETAQQIVLPETTLTDMQGAITVDVTPLNSSSARNSLNFSVSLNTHSIDLSMDLASLAALSTDNGRTVQAILWEAPRGGHHVAGTLTFPALMNGQPLLDGATTLTLTIQDLDASERVFTWDLQ